MRSQSGSLTGKEMIWGEVSCPRKQRDDVAGLEALPLRPAYYTYTPPVVVKETSIF